ARNVVHRDLKPSNLFLEEHAGVPPRIKVLDLGVAKVLSATAGDTTAIVGSVPYMPPEQLHGRAVAPAADLYALGVIAFTLLTGALGVEPPPVNEDEPATPAFGDDVNTLDETVSRGVTESTAREGIAGGTESADRDALALAPTATARRPPPLQPPPPTASRP